MEAVTVLSVIVEVVLIGAVLCAPVRWTLAGAALAAVRGILTEVTGAEQATVIAEQTGFTDTPEAAVRAGVPTEDTFVEDVRGVAAPDWLIEEQYEFFACFEGSECCVGVYRQFC